MQRIVEKCGSSLATLCFTISWLHLLSLALLCCAPLTLCQPTYPHVTFRGRTLSNHSFVNLSRVQDSLSLGLQCHTDLEACCSDTESRIHRGDWFFPGGARLPFPGSEDIDQGRGYRRVNLHRKPDGVGPSGMYRCEVPTVAVHTDRFGSHGESVYVGLYFTGGDVRMSQSIGITVISDLNGPTPQFTLSCVSTGGPATTVTWTRDSVSITEGTETVLVDPTTARYIHRLTERRTGTYTCSVANSKQSNDSASVAIQGTAPPTDVRAVQDGPTSITLSWSHSSDATGYNINYLCGGSEDRSVSLDDASVNTHTLMARQNGETCTVSIVATSDDNFPSEAVHATISLVPGQPVVVIESTSATSISLSWSLPAGSVVTRYEVRWESESVGECADENRGNTTITDGSTTSYDIVELEEANVYRVSVTAFNAAGGTSENFTARTLEAVPSAAPLSVRVSSRIVSTATIQWEPVECIHRNGDLIGYSVKYNETGSSIDRSHRVSGGDSTEAALTGLTLSTTYTVQVAAVNSVGTGVYSDPLTLETNALSVSVGTISTTHITLSWRLVEGLTASSYTISYSNTNTDCFSVSYDDITAIVGRNTLTLNGLEEGTEYSITVTASLSDMGTEEESVVATTLSATPSSAPDSVTLTHSTFSDLTIQWTPVPCIYHNGQLTGYSILYGPVGDTLVELVSEGYSTEVTVSGLAASTEYSIQVAAVNTAGVGVYSKPLAVRTRESVYLSLRGDYVPRHTYLHAAEVGSTDDTSLLCHTNAPGTIRPGRSHSHSGGEWFSPSGARIGNRDVPSFTRNRDPMVVRLLSKTESGETPEEEGVYCCKVDDGDSVNHRVCVGLYNDGGDIAVSEDTFLSVNSSLNGPTPQFTLSCVSTGGPATTVTWTRDSLNITEGTETVLVDPVTAQYTHTLTVSGRPEGLYTCTVSNSKPSEDSAQLNITISDSFEEIVLLNSTSTSLTFSWTLTPVARQLVTTSNITCSPLVEGIPPPAPLLLESNDTSGSVTGLSPGVEYTCLITAGSPTETSTPHSITHSTLEIAPTGSPEGFEARAGEREVVFSWSLPPVVKRNGFITNYTLTCSPSPSSLPQSPAQSGTLTVTGFSPNTLYSCSVAADNSRGSGPPAITSFTTLEDYSYFQLHLGEISSCSEFTTSSTDEKLDEITSAVREELGDSCTDCVITSDTIDEQYFYCDPESPVFVTYRARLEGTPHTDSSELLSLVDRWKNSRPGIIVGRVHMTVDSECSVEIYSLTDGGECRPLVTDTTAADSRGIFDNSAAVIGGAVAIILIVSITVVVVSIVSLKLVGHCRRDKTHSSVWRAEEHMMADIPGEPDVKGHNIPTYTNSAYYTVKHRQEGGGGGEEVTGDSVSVVEETHYAVICPAPNSAVSPAPLSPHEYEIPVATDDPPPTAAHNPLATPNYANVGMAARASLAEAVEEAVYAHISEEK